MNSLSLIFSSCLIRNKNGFNQNDSLLISPFNRLFLLIKKVSKDEKNVDCVFRNLAILQKNILDIDLTQRFLVKVDQVFNLNSRFDIFILVL